MVNFTHHGDWWSGCNSQPSEEWPHPSPEIRREEFFHKSTGCCWGGGGGGTMGGRVHVTHTVHAHAWMHTFWRNGYHTWGREGGHSTQLLLGDSFSLCLWIPMYLSGVKLQCVGTDCTSGFLCLYLTINAFHYPPLFKTNSRSFCGFRRNDFKKHRSPTRGSQKHLTPQTTAFSQSRVTSVCRQYTSTDFCCIHCLVMMQCDKGMTSWSSLLLTARQRVLWGNVELKTRNLSL